MDPKEKAEVRLLELEAEKAKVYPNREEMAALNIRRIAGDDKAREEMIMRNQKLAHWFAAKTVPPNTPDYDDAFQAGMLGIMEAVDRFDHTKGANFGTYAVWWIRQKVYRQKANTGQTIRIPVGVGQQVRKVKAIAFRLQEQLGEKPSLEQIAEETGLSVSKISKLFRVTMTTQSLDEPIELGDGDAADLYKMTPDHKAHMPSDTAAIKDDCRRAAQMMKGLYEYVCDLYGDVASSSSSRIFFTKNGLFGYGPSRTLEETASEFGVTRERVRKKQLHRKYLGTSLHPCPPIRNQQVT
ncbi:MAG: sigma-70 family RNA polymerase sigma factor [Candidatus Pacebacteria bacterium]|nr:sigma-70 family RNA polymerase sigma factor [Candidatus Paceibacterota bacterium]